MTHKNYLQQAFILSAEANKNDIKPNPFVGAILVNDNGEIIGRGFHKKIGAAHAEVFAIEEALKVQQDLSSTTLYVTLEPCSHFGKTPPCCNLIIEHKIKKVVIAMKDPNPLVNGIEILKQNGVEVIVEPLKEVNELNQTFIINKLFNRPKFYLKTAQTIDGKIADRNGTSHWLSNDKSRQYAHKHLRQNVDAIVTTYKTVVLDNASFNVRLSGGEIIEKNCIVIDRNLELLNEKYNNLKIFYPRKKTNLYLVTDKKVDTKKYPNIEIIHVNWSNESVDLIELSKTLYLNNFYEVLIEAGGKLLGSFMKNNLVDELWVYIVPKIINDNEAVKSFNYLQENLLVNASLFTLKDLLCFDDDVLIKYQNLK